MSDRNVVLLDYGIGNVHSVAKALRAAGAVPILSSDHETVRSAERLVVPGVGAFADCMGCLLDRHLEGPVLDFIKTGRPFLGICVGMQMLFTQSLEFGIHRGLGVIDGTVERLKEEEGLKIPHVGWNAIEPVRPWRGTVLEECTEGDMLYFAHSFHATPSRDEDRIADANYGANRICAAIKKGNVMGTQFHPEKSGEVGLRVLRRFVQLP